MPKSSNQKLKLLYLLDILEKNTDENHSLSTNELIAMLADCGINAERKSLYDDIEQLEFFGVDVISYKNKSNYYYIGSRTFELPELKLLVDTVQSSKFLTRKKSEELIRKIENLCSKHEASQLQRQVFVANRIKNMNESIYYNVDKIQNAICDNKQISFKYFHYNVNLERELKKNGQKYIISPYSLMWDDENYYLLGFDSESGIFKHYRVDRIDTITILENERLGSKEFEKVDISKYNNKVFSMYGGEEKNIKLEFENSLINVVVDRFGKEIFIRKADDNHFFINADIIVSPQFFGWLFSLQGKAKIVSPQSVIDMYKEQINSVLTNF